MCLEAGRVLASRAEAANTLVVALTDAAKELSTAYNALRVDLLDVKQLVNSVIDDLQALGLLQ